MRTHPPTAEPDGRIRVVLVDDHAMFAESLAAVLADHANIEVVGMARASADAAECVARHRPDVVLVDHSMPGCNGFEVSARIRAGSPRTGLVMLADSDDEPIVNAAVGAGCSGFLTKHRPLSDLAATIRTVAGGGTAFSTKPTRCVSARAEGARRPAAADLTARESEILTLMGAGWGNERIAERLFLSRHTIRNHVQSILVKLGVHSKLEAVSRARSENLLDLSAPLDTSARRRRPKRVEES